jgi:hypothetical protein
MNVLVQQPKGASRSTLAFYQFFKQLLTAFKQFLRALQLFRLLQLPIQKLQAVVEVPAGFTKEDNGLP